MAHYNTVFHQVLANSPWRRFSELVEQHRANKGVRRLGSKTHVTALLFHQFAETATLRRLVGSFNSHHRRLHHIGCGKLPRSTLSDANASRPVAPFAGLFAALLSRAQSKLACRAREATLIIDSTIAPLNRLSGE